MQDSELFRLISPKIPSGRRINNAQYSYPDLPDADFHYALTPSEMATLARAFRMLGRLEAAAGETPFIPGCMEGQEETVLKIFDIQKSRNISQDETLVSSLTSEKVVKLDEYRK